MSLAVKIGAAVVVLAGINAVTSPPVKYYTLDSRHDSGVVITVAGPFSETVCEKTFNEMIRYRPVNANYAISCVPHR